MPTTIINSTASKTSGSLTVLKDCIAYLETQTSDSTSYHLFTVVDDFEGLKNVHVHKLESQNWLSRIIWDNGGLQNWCNRNNLEPDVIISLQNTSTKYRNKAGLMIVHVVYYHQTIPLYKWNGLMNHSLKLWLYHYFYPFFVNRNNKSSHYVVQLPYIKELFCKKFKNISPDRVFVIRPNIPNIDINSIPKKQMDKFTFFYPADGYSYKNHEIIIRALALLSMKNPLLINNIRVIFTLDSLPFELRNLIHENNLTQIVHLIGKIAYTDVLSYYKSADALLFPSKMESFGLPLIEATCFGLPVIAADLPYAREVLGNYSNKVFVDSDSVDKWVDAIRNYQVYKKVYHNDIDIRENSWKSFFELANRLVQERSHD